MRKTLSLLGLVMALSPMAAPLASARSIVDLDNMTGNSQSFVENTILNKTRMHYPCNAPKGARYCHKEDGSIDKEGLNRVIEVRTTNYGYNRTTCENTSMALRKSNAHCDKGDRPFDNDQADGI